jgi:hypothetical protein
MNGALLVRLSEQSGVALKWCNVIAGWMYNIMADDLAIKKKVYLPGIGLLKVVQKKKNKYKTTLLGTISPNRNKNKVRLYVDNDLREALNKNRNIINNATFQSLRIDRSMAEDVLSGTVKTIYRRRHKAAPALGSRLRIVAVDGPRRSHKRVVIGFVVVTRSDIVIISKTIFAAYKCARYQHADALAISHGFESSEKMQEAMTKEIRIRVIGWESIQRVNNEVA